MRRAAWKGRTEASEPVPPEPESVGVVGALITGKGRRRQPPDRPSIEA
jgi:hypothetical protein